MPGLWSPSVALLLALLPACAKASLDTDGYTLALELAPSPPVTGPATALLVVTDGEQRPVEGAVVKVEGNMNHAGMVPVFADAVEIEPGRYRAEFEFTMGGDWFLLVDAETPDGRTLHWQRDVPGVARAQSGN